MSETSPPWLDQAGQLTHALIRHQCQDGLDPYLVHGHPSWVGADASPSTCIRACFYYTAIVDDDFTLLLDNQGQGGMCNLELWEVAAVWDTQELLDALGWTQADLTTPSDQVVDPARLPPPRLNAESLYRAFGDRHGEASVESLLRVLKEIRQMPQDQPPTTAPSWKSLPETGGVLKHLGEAPVDRHAELKQVRRGARPR